MNADQPLSEQYRIVAKKWVEADSAANILEETKSAVLAKMMADLGDMPVSRAEMKVKSSDEWHDHVRHMVDARSKASAAKIEAEYLKMRFYEWQSQAATRRAEMKL